MKHKMDHLVCFVPAMLALGSHMGAVTGAKAESYMQLAVNLTETCWQFYHTQPTGVLLCLCMPCIGTMLECCCNVKMPAAHHIAKSDKLQQRPCRPKHDVCP